MNRYVFLGKAILLFHFDQVPEVGSLVKKLFTEVRTGFIETYKRCRRPLGLGTSENSGENTFVALCLKVQGERTVTRPEGERASLRT